MNKLTGALIALLLAFSMLMGMVGCEKEGDFEKAGKKIDKAVEETKEKVEDAADKAKDKAGELQKKVDQATDKK